MIYLVTNSVLFASFVFILHVSLIYLVSIFSVNINMFKTKVKIFMFHQQKEHTNLISNLRATNEQPLFTLTEQPSSTAESSEDNRNESPIVRTRKKGMVELQPPNILVQPPPPPTQVQKLYTILPPPTYWCSSHPLPLRNRNNTQHYHPNIVVQPPPPTTQEQKQYTNFFFSN